jgi:hypothetical protein
MIDSAPAGAERFVTNTRWERGAGRRARGSSDTGQAEDDT